MDTSAWFALLVIDDAAHHVVQQWFDGNTEDLVTTDYVLDELLTLLKVRGQTRQACAVGQRFLDETISQLIYLSVEDIEEAWQLFRRFDDKAWSFTDCTSYVVMQRLGITVAAALDDHFRQFGFANIVPG